MLTESLNIYAIDKDGNKVTFPNVEGMQPAIVDVNLNRERMAGAPTNTSTLMYPVCLDSYWTKKEFIEIGSERFYVKQVPTSEKNTEDTRYKHEITFVSERDILENVFFFDCVTQEASSQISDKPRTNTAEFSFYGDLNELVQRLNDSLSYSKIYDPKGENGFCIVIDDDVEIGEAKEVSMTDAYFATAMQEIYNVFEVPYYWVGKVCHVGYQENEITEPFEYGSGNGLISVQKTNAEFRLINRITGQGSADNIPYYYPNTDPNGIPVTEYKNMQESDISGVVPTKIANLVGGIIGKRIYFGEIQKGNGTVLINEQQQYAKKETWQISKDDQDFGNDVVERDYSPGFEKYEISFYANVGDKIDLTKAQFKYNVTIVSDYNVTCNPIPNKDSVLYWGNGVDADIIVTLPDGNPERITNNDLTYTCVENGLHRLTIHCNPIYDYINCHVDFPENKDVVPVEATFAFTLTGSIFLTTTEGNVVVCDNVIYPEKKIPFEVSDWGALRLLNIVPTFDATKGIVVKELLQGYDYSSCSQFCITDIKKTNIMSKLMPSIYRKTEGAERFYNAKNETYKDDNGNYYSFNNPYVPSEPLEGKQDFEDIKPTINGITNENGELFGEIAAVAFDDTDSDDLSIEDASDANTNTAKPVHPYFYVKLHKFSGKNGFNLFKQGLAQGAMTFNFITGSCAGCSFKVQVSEGKQVDNHYEFENLVQVDEQGNIVAGDSGDKIKASNPIASQQDTMTNSVWIALEKDNSTFGVLMPNATNNYRPQGKTELREGDKFVITNILLPTQYITAAEKRLDAALVKYMSENNDEKFTFSIKFSRIYLQEHPEIAEKINENTKLHVKYNNVDYPLFVSSYSRKSDDNILDEISVELSEKLTITQNKSKEQMDSIMGNVNEQINSAIQDNNNNTSQGASANDINSLKTLLGNKLSRVSDDTAAGIITFLQGTNWGSFTSETGAAMTVDPSTGQTYMEVDRLKVRLKAFFEKLEVQKVGFVGGKLIVTKGQGVDILDVENIYDSEGNVSAYRCYFLGEQEGRKIDNLLRVKDQMICKDFNVSEGSTDGATNKYYWRLATAVSTDVVKRGNNVCHWVDLSATDCDTNSDIPEIGDTICHLGNREDTDRQGAEILSVVDANSPSFTIYSGINSYSLVNKEYIDMGVVNGKAYCNIYGSTYIGDRDRKNGYLRWNDDTKTFEIKGTIDITSPLSSGGTIGGAIDNAANAYKGEFDTFTSNVTDIIGGFQAQIDGVIETWFYEPEPTLGNEPAVNWTDNTTKDKHLGDLYYSGEGLAYRFQKEGDNYVWKQIDDTAITKALAEAKAANDAANAAQGTADSKMRVFVVQPTAEDEYSVGDMWVNATYPSDGSTYNNEILHCVTKKAAGEAFSISHWAQSSNIKTQFNNFVNNTYAEDKKDFYNQLDGKVETWYQKDDPKDKWSAADYSKHKGDIWYNDSENKSYRWTGTAWVELKDQAAIDAKTLAESKRRVFTTTALPTPPYDAKDLWVQGENGDIMVCVTPKAAGTTASASDWTKASKYTDDTAAKAAQAAADEANASITELGGTVSGIYNLTDEAFKDRVIDKTERDSLQKVLADLVQDWADVTSSYSKLTENSLYDSIAADVKADFTSAYNKLKATYESFETAVNNVISAEQVTDSLINGLYNNYQNFKTDYAAYVSIMTVATKQIDAILNKSVSDLVTELGGYKYLKKATAENNTLIEGGLILSTLIGLGYTDTNKLFHVMSGMSGIYDTQKTGNGIAFWAGGSMVDKQNDASENPAQFLVRHDGTGYAAGGKLWWEKDGKVHADPMSFVVGEDNLKNLLGLFRPVYSGGTGYEYITGVEPQFQFTKLRVEGGNISNGELIGGLQIGDTAKFYIKDGVLFLDGDLAVTGGITMYASNGVTSGLLDQVYAILDSSKFEIENGVITIKGDIGGGTVKGATLGGVAVTLNANGILEFDAYPTTLPASDVYAWAKAATKPSYSWGEITEKPTLSISGGVITIGTNSITPLTAHQKVTLASGTNNGTLKLTVGSTTTDNIAVKGLGSAAYTDSSAYAKASHTHSQYLVASSLDGYVNALTDNTSTNVFVTAIAKSGKTLSYTKSFTKKSLTSASHSGWSSVDTDKLIIPDMSFIAYWNGAYNSDGKSNLAYCNAGAFGDMATASKSSYYIKTEVDTKLTDGSVTKVGTVNVGATNIPIYLKAGVPTAVTLVDTANNLINNLTTGTSTPEDADYYVAQYVGGGTTTTTFHRRPHSALYAYIKGKAEGTWAISVSGNAATATTLQNARTLWGQSFNGSANISGNMSGVGQITFSDLTGTNGRSLLYQKMADNDYFRIYAGGTGNNGGYAEIATADDGNEPIYVRQYSGVFGTLVRTLTLLDGNGNTTVPGLLTAANGTVNGTLKVGAIPVTNSSTGVLKIDGNLIVTGGITMYATDGVASGLMEQILVDGTTIGKKADGTLYAINTGNVRSIIMGSTTYTPNDSGAVTLPEKVTWANIEGKPSTFTPSSHTHSSITIPVCSSLNGNSNVFSVEYVGGNNSVATKPSGVDAFGVMRLRTAAGWYGQIMMSANAAPGIYYRNANGLSSSVGWKKLLDSGNFGDYAAAKSHTHAISQITNLQTILDGKAAASHTHSYLPLSGGTLSGRLLVNYDGNSHTAPAIAINYYDSYSVDEYSIAQIKMGTPKYDAYLGLSPAAKGYYGKAGYFMHIGTDYEFLWATSGWTKRMALECSSGNLWVAGSVTASSFVGNASSASKWATARTITLTGSVTGSVSIDGSGNVSLATTTNHTHSYLPLAGGTLTGTLTTSNVVLGGTLAFKPLTSATDLNNLTTGLFHTNTDDNTTSNITNRAFDIGFALISAEMFISGSDIRRAQLAMDGYGNAKIRGSRTSGYPWYTILTSANYTSYAAAKSHTHAYLPLAGGTMTGALNFKNGTWNLVGDDAYIGDCNVAGMIGVKGANAATPGFVLYNNSGTLLGKLYASGGTLVWDGGTIQATTFSGNASTATKLQTARTIWGQSFDGTRDISIGVAAKMPYVLFKNYNDDNEAGYCGRGASSSNQIYLTAYSGNAIGMGANNTDNVLFINTSLNVGIGTTSPSEKLHVVGNILASGGITMYSDLRKKNILSNEVLSVKEIAAAPLFRHTYKSDDNQYIHVGTSAQYWSGIHEDWFTRKDREGYYQMELQNLGVAMGISLAREIVKYESKTDKKIRLMKKKINDLEARIKELEERRTA